MNELAPRRPHGTRRIACLIGTRPEAVKMAPVILALREQRALETRIIASGQHRELVDQSLAAFDLKADLDLQVMRPGQQLADLTARLIERLDSCFAHEQPDLVVGQGDTTSVLAAALAAFYRRIPFAHVEAGLRSFDLEHPFPEELNRQLVSRIARLHFAPLETNRANLLREGVAEDRIHVTGNPVVDAVLRLAASTSTPPLAVAPDQRLVLLTVHRRENHGAPLDSILAAARDIVDADPRVVLVVPVHPNPVVLESVHAALDDHPRIRLVPPLSYPHLLATLKQAALVLTDSGGIQEEGPVLGAPVLVLRQTTERAEAVSAGAARLVGTDRARIGAAAIEILRDEALRSRMTSQRLIFGDGQAGRRIAGIIAAFLGCAEGTDTPCVATELASPS